MPRAKSIACPNSPRRRAWSDRLRPPRLLAKRGALSTFVRLIELLAPHQRVRLALLAVAMFVTAFLETLSVASVLPFVSVAADPGLIRSNPWLSWAYAAFGFTTTDGFLVALAAGALLALLLSNVWMATTHWAQLRFASVWNYSLGVQLLGHYLAKPYVFFLRHNTANLSKNILDDVEQVAGDVIVPGLRLFAKAAVALSIVALLVFVDPVLALVVAGGLGGSYAALCLHVRRRLAQIGQDHLITNTGRFKAVSEAFGAIKDLKLLGRVSEPVARFEGAARRHARSQANAAIIADLPRYALDVLAFGSALVVAIYLLLRSEGLRHAIPFLGLYAFAGYRLMPSLQQVFQSYARIRFGTAALTNLHRELAQAGPAAGGSRPAGGSRERSEGVLPFTARLDLEGVTFSYPEAPKPTLQSVTLTIEAKTTVGIMGPTGSGKTTLVDVILGLLRPQAGEIRIDGRPLTDGNLRRWQSSIGYVPQHIYLSDDSITRNIAFGLPDAAIDQEAVERAARVAHIHEFITRHLPDGYETLVGERGIRLSGGQRQRLGIARALYHDPAVLVLDEATSALDQETEAAVMNAIEELAGTRTILMIAHRLTSLSMCNARVRLIEGGRVVSEPVADLAAILAPPRSDDQPPVRHGRSVR